jgi:hypothetical protein
VQRKLPETPPRGLGATNSTAIDLDKLCIATHLKNLIAWSDDKTTTLLHGEKGYEGVEDCCVLKVDSDLRNKRHTLLVSGEGRVRRASRLQHLVATLQSHRRVYKLLGWKVQHRDSILDSDILLEQQKVYHATALFHTPEGRVIAECTSLSSKALKDLSTFLTSLVPREDEWTMTAGAGKVVKSREWSAFLHHFALFTKIKDSNATTLTISVWGFGSMVDEARKSLADGEHADLGGPLLDLKSSAAILQSSSEVSQVIVFKEKEMGFYYLAFENEVNLFLKETYGAVARKVDVDFTLVTKKNFPPVKVELLGRPDAVQSAKVYIERMGENAVHKVYFPKVDAAKYKVWCGINEYYLCVDN